MKFCFEITALIQIKSPFPNRPAKGGETGVYAADFKKMGNNLADIYLSRLRKRW